MASETKMLIISAAVFIVLIIIALAVAVKSDNGTLIPPDPQVTSLAQCLSDKGVKMYGAVWCSRCQAQKKLFGSAFKLINYVECTTDAQKCIDAKIESYPTWTFA
ncbi:MAG: hypothetical protein WC797_03500, partial [Candidatus Paceibacterota bacterium]